MKQVRAIHELFLLYKYKNVLVITCIRNVSISHDPLGIPATSDGGRASDPQCQEDPAHFFPSVGDHAVPLHVPDCPGISGGRMGLL